MLLRRSLEITILVALAGCGGLRERPITARDGGPLGSGGSSAGASGQAGRGGTGGSVGGTVGSGGTVGGAGGSAGATGGSAGGTGGSVGDAGMDGPTCTAGGACVPANPCHKGQFVCGDGGAMTCMDLNTLQANGTVCDVDKVCHNGSCDSCVADMACDVSGKPCRVGSIVCTTGAPVCTETDNKPNGTSCGTGMVCQSGACAQCQAGAACQPTNKCHNGTLTCSPSISCTDANTNVAAGTSCGTDLVCSGQGACVACVAGSDCAVPGKPCSKGMTACNTGAPVCIESGNAPNGTVCGNGMVCQSGACMQCSAGAACVPANPCHGGITVCSPNIGCTDTGNSLANGVSCGTDKVCNAGTCVSCAANSSCQPQNPCKTGVTSCATGSPVCQDSVNQPNGTTCGTNMVCNAGSCAACTSGTCVPAGNPCHTGTLSCSTGAPVCTDNGANQPDGSSCGTNLVCKGGSCVSCTANQACQPANQCKTGTTSCATGASVCVESGNKGSGTLCGAAQSCANGILTLQGMCNASGMCTAGTMQCTNGCNTSGTDCATCPNGQTSCPSGCKDLTRDPTNCGGCGMVCPAPAPNTGIPLCVNQSCDISCNPGFLECLPVSLAMCQTTVWDFESGTIEGFKLLLSPSAVSGKFVAVNTVSHTGKYSLGVPINATGQLRQFDVGPTICADRGPAIGKGLTVYASMALVPSNKPDPPGRGSYVGIRITSESGDTLVKATIPGYSVWFDMKAALPAGDTQVKQIAIEGVFAPPDTITTNPDWVGAVYIDDVMIQ